MNSNVQNNSIISTSYEDLGQVITATNMAAGSTVYSNWYDGVQWVRNLRMLVQTDQQYDVGCNYRDTSLTNSWFLPIASNQTATNPNWSSHSATPSGTSAILGYSVRFGIKNSSASANTFANLKVQLLGL